MSSSSISSIPPGSIISLESHSKQVKLLNDYIKSLETRLGEGRQTDSNRILKLSEEANRLNDENIKLKNEVSQLKYSIYKHEQALRQLPRLEQEMVNLKGLLQKENQQKNTLAGEYQKLASQLGNCEQHLMGAEREINNRTEYFQNEKAKLQAVIDNLNQQMEQKKKKSQELEKLLAEEKKNTVAKVKSLENANGEAIRLKNQSMAKLIREVEEAKVKLGNEVALASTLKTSHSTQAQDLVKQLNDSRIESAALRKESSQMKVFLERKGEEVNSTVAKLNTRNQDYENLVRTSNQQKSNLIRIVRRLQQEKKNVQVLNQAAKGDMSTQVKQIAQVLKRNETLAAEVSVRVAQRDEFKKKLKEMDLALSELTKEKYSMKEFYEDQIRQIRENLNGVTNQYFAYQKKTETEIQILNSKIKDFTSDQAVLRDRSNSSVQQYFTYKKQKEAEIEGLNTKIKEIVKEQQGLRQTLESTKQEYLGYQKRKEFQTEDLNNKLRELLKEQASLRDALDSVTREYNTFQKKREADVDSLSERLKQASKKIEKKDLKIEQMLNEMKEFERLSEANRKNMDSSQREDLDRLKVFYARESNDLRALLNESSQANEHLTAEKQVLLKKVDQLQIQVKSLREEIKVKEKSSSEIQRNMVKQREQLLNEIKGLNLSSVMETQSINSKEQEVQSLKKAIVSLENFKAEQKKNMDSLTKLLAAKQQELQSLETSNAMLRKQLIASINNEESSRKEVIEVKSRNGTSSIAQHKRPRHANNVYKSQIPIHSSFVKQDSTSCFQSNAHSPPDTERMIINSREGRSNTVMIQHYSEQASLGLTPEKETLSYRGLI